MGFPEIVVGLMVSASFLIGQFIYQLALEEVDKFRNKIINLTAPGAAMFLGLFVMPVLQMQQELVLILLGIGMVSGLLTADLKQNIRNSAISFLDFIMFDVLLPNFVSVSMFLLKQITPEAFLIFLCISFLLCFFQMFSMSCSFFCQCKRFCLSFFSAFQIRLPPALSNFAFFNIYVT